MSESDIQKLYYSIGEVSQMLDIDQPVLRFWETEFKELSPRKSKSGKRQYKEYDLKVLRRIKQLLYKERYTIEGARRKLATKEKPTEIPDKIREKFQQIKTGLQELKQIIEK
ncbi:MAG: MerR family transcriptional regulator [Candidatus Hatepunaea meridiana]|nr:MerR family transcriptional regulator [Candidatus Hatepunaea meridiana]